MSDLITESYRKQQAALHAGGNYGTAALAFGPIVQSLLTRLQPHSLLDYGCGSQRSLLKAISLPTDALYEGYDPAVADYAEPPLPAELVVCIDVLEHIEPSLLANVLDHLASLCDPFGFFSVHTGPARKTLPDGRNAHLTQQPQEWWLPLLEQRFRVLELHPVPKKGFYVLVRARQ